MVTSSSMDMLSWFRKQVEEADGDLVREMVRVFAETLMSAEATCPVVTPAYGSARRSGRMPSQWLPVAALRHAGGDDGGRHPKAAQRQLFPRLAARPAAPGGAGAGRRDCRMHVGWRQSTRRVEGLVP